MRKADFVLIPGGIALVMTVLLSGCTPSGVGSVHGIHQRSSSFSHYSEHPVPGIDEGSIAVVTLQAGPPAGVPFVIWSDTSNSSSHGGGTPGGGASYEEEQQTADGRVITIAAETIDGITATLTIDDTPYDLQRGSLFLISTQNGTLAVKQIEFDVVGFPTDYDPLRQIADENPKIGEFFRSAVAGKPDGSESADDAELTETEDAD